MQRSIYTSLVATGGDIWLAGEAVSTVTDGSTAAEASVKNPDGGSSLSGVRNASPLPWRVAHFPESGLPYIVDAHGETVADVVTAVKHYPPLRDGRQEVEANAQLIVTAVNHYHLEALWPC